MADLENFLCYWSDPNTKQDDVAFRLAHAYETTTARLTVLRHTTLDVLQPVKNSKGAWVPGFAPDAIDRAAARSIASGAKPGTHAPFEFLTGCRTSNVVCLSTVSLAVVVSYAWASRNATSSCLVLGSDQ